jgi:filamentous hemagglutinin family protein
MKYTRKFTRQQENKYLPQAAKQSHRELTISIMAGVLAMCFALSPVGEASTYSRADGGPAAVVNGNTADIYAGKMINNQTIAVNNFSKFNVSSGDIANMHFNTAAGNPKADSLVNFSRSSMDINGTINAMGKGGSGTGNIYFFTPQGITVGANGMINATNIYMAVPSTATMDRMLNNDSFTRDVVGWGDMFNTYANDVSFPLNPSGTITIEKASSLHYTNTAQLLANKLIVKDEGIQRTDGGDTNFINTGDGNFIIEVFAGKIFPNTSLAVNTFDQYNVKSNEKVYMFFSTMDGNDDGIYNLVNLVNKRININGEVDAIKANLNEANMYFLSPEGTTIGPNGIINAGYYVNLAPTTSEYNNLLKGGYDAINRVTTNPEDIQINPNSTITVNGVINTYNGMLMRAGKSIDVVSAVKDDLGTVSKPSLNSSLNFANMVNLTPTQETYVNPNAKTELKYTKSGDIVLDVTVNNANNAGGIINHIDTATINQEGTISARGKVKMVANASSEDRLTDVLAPKTEATINVNGKVTGANVDIEATAENKDSSNTIRKLAKGQVEGTGIGKTPIGKLVKFDVSYASLHSKANVNVGKNAQITSTEKTMDKGKDENGNEGKDRSITIKAKSTITTDTAVNKKASIDNDKNRMNFTGTWLNVENDAGVNIQGKLHSADGANITSNAKSDIKISSSVFSGTRKIKDGKGQPYAIAALKVGGHNNATTTLAEGSELTLDGGDVNVTSNAKHKINSSTNALGNREGAVSAALSYTGFNSSGRTEVGTGIVTNSGNITILGTDTVEENTITTNAGAGKAGDPKFVSALDSAFLGPEDSFKNILMGWMGTGLPVADTDALVKKANVSVAYQMVNENNKGTVIVHKVPIKASGKVNIHSEMDMQDVKFNVDGKAYNKSNNYSEVEGVGAGAALVSSMSNKSDTIVEGGGKDAQGQPNMANAIVGDGVSITAITKLPENTYTRALRELNTYYKNKEGQSTWGNVREKLVGLIPYLGSGNITKDVFEKYWGGIVEGKFLTPGQYTNFSVRALTDQGTGDTKTESTGVGGSVNINTLANESRVIIGENRVIDSEQKSLETKSEVTGTLTSMTGNPGDKLTPATSQGSIAGGSVSVQTYKNSSITQVGQEANLLGKQVDVHAANNTLGLNLVLGSGYGQGVATINGMMGVVRGEQTAMAAVDKTASINTFIKGDGLSIIADNHPVILNAATSLFANSSSSSDSAGVANLGAALNTVDVNTFAGTTDLTYGSADREQNAKLKGSHAIMEAATAESLSRNLSKDEIESITTEAKQRVEEAKAAGTDLDFQTAFNKIAYARQMGYVENSTRKGQLIANKITVQANTNGSITSIGANGAIADSGTTSSLIKGFGQGINYLPDKANEYLGAADNLVGNLVQKLPRMITRGIKNKWGWKYLRTKDVPVPSGEKEIEMHDLSDNVQVGVAGQPDAAKYEAEQQEAILQQAQNQGQARGESVFDLSVAGSGAVNQLNENTIAVLEGANVSLMGDGGVTVHAQENVRNIAVAGAGTLNAFSNSKNVFKTTGGAEGTLALNENTHTVLSAMRGTNVNNAASVQSLAETRGDEMALALGATGNISNETFGSSVNAGGVAGINMSTQTTEATIDGGAQRSSINGLNTIVSAQATDTSTAKAISTGVVGGNASDLSHGVAADVGIAGAYNQYGTADNPNVVKASVRNMNVTDAAKVEALAKDNSDLTTVALGLEGSKNKTDIGGSYGQAKVNKQIYSSVEGTNIRRDKNTVDAQLVNTATNEGSTRTYTGSGALSFGQPTGGSSSIGASVSINSVTTDTKATVQGGNMRVANNSIVKAISNANVQGVSSGVAGTTQGKAAGAGSVSYNNVTNNAHAAVSDATMFSTGSIGVIAESDDRLNELAGGLVGGHMLAGGFSVGANRTNGDTSALVENSDITALGNDEIGVAASDVDDKALIEGRMRNPYNDDNRLKKARTDKNYRGLVVHSSATHDVTALQGTAGLTIGSKDKSAGNLVGAMGINSVQGSTTALIKNSKVNSQLLHNSTIDGTKALGNDVNVVAKDYTNNQGIGGGASLDIGLGGSTVQGTIGGSGQNNTVGRVVSAKVIGDDAARDKKDYSIKARNFNVDAISKQHMSSVDLGSAVTVSLAGMATLSGGAGLAWNTMTGSTEAGVEGAHVQFNDTANVHSLHEGKIYGGSGVLALAVSASGGSGGLGLASVTNRDESGTTAFVKNSVLVAADGNKESTASVTAHNESYLDNLMGSGGVAVTNPFKPVAVAAAGAMSRNYMKSTVSAVVENSTIEAGRVKDFADNKETVYTRLGGAGLGLGGGVGASVGLNYINDRQYAIVRNSSLHALGPDTADGKALVVGTDVSRTTDEGTNAVSLGIGAINLNWLETKVNYEDKGEALVAEDNDPSKVAEARRNINEQNSLVESMFGDLFSNTDSAKKKDEQDKLVFGAHTIVEGSKVTADAGTASVTANEGTNYSNGGLSMGTALGGAMGSVAKLKENHQVDVNVLNSSISGVDTQVNAHRGNLNTEGNYIHTRQGGASGLSVDVSWASATAKGNTDVNVTNSDITATKGKAAVTAKDETKTKTVASGLQVIGQALPSYNNALNDNTSEVNVKIDGTNNTRRKTISGSKELEITATKATETIADGWGYSVGIGFEGAAALGRATDSGNATVSVLGKKYILDTEGQSTVKAYNLATVKGIVSGEAAGLGASVGRSKSEAYLTGKAKTTIASDNTFDADNLDIGAVVGTQGKFSATSTAFGGATGLVTSVNADSAVATTDTEAVVDVGDEKYVNKNKGTGGRIKQLNIKGENYTSREADMWGHSTAIVGVSNGANKAIAEGKDRVNVIARGGEAQNVTVLADNQSFANANGRNVTTSGIANVSPYAAAANSDINSASEVTLTGKWIVKDNLKVNAKETDTNKVHSDSVNIGTGVSIGSADATANINDYVDEKGVAHGTHVIIDKNASIHTGTMEAKSINALVIDKGDKLDDKGNLTPTTETISTGNYGILYVQTKDPGVTEKIKKTSQITVEKRDDNMTSVKSTGEQVYEASTKDTVHSKVFGSAVSAVAEAGVKNDVQVDVTDKVNLNGRIAGSKSKEITLSAWDESDVGLDSEARATAFFGGAHTYNTNMLKRTNNVTINGEVADTSRLNVYVNRKADGATPIERLRSISYNNDAAMGKTNTPNVNQVFDDNSSITMLPGTLQNVTKTHIVLNVNSGLELINDLLMKRWDHWFWPFSTHIERELGPVTRTGTSSFDAYPYSPNVKNQSVDVMLGYQIGGVKVDPVLIETDKDGKKHGLVNIPKKYETGTASVGIL